MLYAASAINAEEEGDNENGLNGRQEEELVNGHQQQQQLQLQLADESKDGICSTSDDSEYSDDSDDFDGSDDSDDFDEVDGSDDYDDDDDDTSYDTDYRLWCRLIEKNVTSLTNISVVYLCSYQRMNYLGFALQTNTHVTDMTVDIGALDPPDDDTKTLQFDSDSILLLKYLRTTKSLVRFALTSLAQQNNERQPHSTIMNHPSTYMLDAIAQNDTVRCVEINQINVYDSLATLIRRTTSIQKLELRYCSFKKPYSLSPSSKLTKEVNLYEISSALAENTTIESISVFSISDPLLIIAILDGIMNNSSIQDLSISMPKDVTNAKHHKQISNSLNSILANSQALQGLELQDFNFTTDLFRPIAIGIMNRIIPLKTLSFYNCSFDGMDTIIDFLKIAREHVYELRLGGDFEFCSSNRTNENHTNDTEEEEEEEEEFTDISDILCEILQTPTQLSFVSNQSTTRTKPKTTLQHLDLAHLKYCECLFETEFGSALLLNTKIQSLATPYIAFESIEYFNFMKRYIPICSLKKLDLQMIRISNPILIMNSLYRNLSLEKVIFNSADKTINDELDLCVHECCTRNRSIRQSIQMTEWVPGTQKSIDDVTTSNQDEENEYCPISITSLWPHVFESIQDCDTKFDIIFKCISRVLVDSIGTCTTGKRNQLLIDR